MDSRTSKQNYYLDIADAVLERSTCLRRKYGDIEIVILLVGPAVHKAFLPVVFAYHNPAGLSRQERDSFFSEYVL